MSANITDNTLAGMVGGSIGNGTTGSGYLEEEELIDFDAAMEAVNGATDIFADNHVMVNMASVGGLQSPFNGPGTIDTGSFFNFAENAGGDGNDASQPANFAATGAGSGVASTTDGTTSVNAIAASGPVATTTDAVDNGVNAEEGVKEKGEKRRATTPASDDEGERVRRRGLESFERRMEDKQLCDQCYLGKRGRIHREQDTPEGAKTTCPFMHWLHESGMYQAVDNGYCKGFALDKFEGYAKVPLEGWWILAELQEVHRFGVQGGKGSYWIYNDLVNNLDVAVWSRKFGYVNDFDSYEDFVEELSMCGYKVTRINKERKEYFLIPGVGYDMVTRAEKRQYEENLRRTTLRPATIENGVARIVNAPVQQAANGRAMGSGGRMGGHGSALGEGSGQRGARRGRGRGRGIAYKQGGYGGPGW